MKVRFIFGVSVLITIAIFPFPVLAGDDGNPGDIVINEFITNPAGVSDSDGEWVEVHNTTGSAINIDGWELGDGDSSSHTIDAGGTLLVPAHDKLTLCRNENPDENGGVTCDYQYSSIVLTNSGGEITLADDGGEYIAQLIYPDGAQWNSAGQATYYVPSGNPPAGGYFADNSDTAQWGRTDDVPENLYGTTGMDYGTPGLTNTQSGDAPTAITLVELTARPIPNIAFTFGLVIVSLISALILFHRIKIENIVG